MENQESTPTDTAIELETEVVEAPTDGEVVPLEKEGTEIEEEPNQNESESEDYTPLCTSEDPEKKAAYHEYKLLEKNIRYQNQALENLKEDITKIESKPFLTNGEKCDLKNLYDNLDREMVKLKVLIEKAMKLQNTGSRRRYREFPLATTFDEDKLNLTNRTCQTLMEKIRKSQTKSNECRLLSGESSEIVTSCSSRGSEMSVAEERKLIKEICDALKECKSLKETKQQKHLAPCKENNSMEEIQDNIKCMQEALCKLIEDLNKKENPTDNFKSDRHPKTSAIDPAMLCFRKSVGKENHFKQLKENYLYLLTEFSKKDEQLKELTKKLKNSCSKRVGGADICKGQGDVSSVDESELHLLRSRISEMEEEQVEFKCLMREQSLQLEEYRNKYLNAQQKVEEQCVLIEKLNVNNKCIEKQINQEVKEIRAKFQERLTDLLKFPKLLENEQLKLAQMCKEKEELEIKLVTVCKELRTLKSKPQSTNAKDEDNKPLLTKCQQELSQVKKDMEEIKRQRDMFCDQLATTTEDFNNLRCESANIITRTKERAEYIKQQQQEHIDRLEKQLAQCRATACLTVNDREAVIKEMQGQLNTLSYSFDAAQTQIKTLRNHIAYMSNENTFSTKCK